MKLEGPLFSSFLGVAGFFALTFALTCDEFDSTFSGREGSGGRDGLDGLVMRSAGFGALGPVDLGGTGADGSEREESGGSETFGLLG